MPELPEVETVVRGLRPHLEGHRFEAVEVRRPDLRFPLPPDLASRVRGRRVERLGRRAKFILIDLEGGWTLICHLGMSGRLTIEPPPAEGAAWPAPGTHDHLLFALDSGWRLRFNDTRRFGLVDLWPSEELGTYRFFRELGPEPLSNAFSGPVLAERLAGRRSPVKAALLDQRTVAGLGNIYASEALYAAGISPRRLAYTVIGRRAERLAAAIREVLERAIESGGSSLRDYVQPSGELGYFQHQWAVYERAGEPCPACPQPAEETCRIRRIVQSSRATYFCPRRQR